MAVWKESMKKSRAAMVRSPFTLRQTSEARVAMRTAGQSDDGSAWAQEPPIVPQLRTCGSPMPPAASWTTAIARGDGGVRRQAGVGHAGTDAQLAILLGDAVEPRHVADVDHQRGRREAQLQERQQAVAA